MIRKLLLTCLLAAPLFAQSETLGVFTDSADVGAPARKGAGSSKRCRPVPHHRLGCQHPG